jgi:hypothetical protein
MICCFEEVLLLTVAMWLINPHDIYVPFDRLRYTNLVVVVIAPFRPLYQSPSGCETSFSTSRRKISQTLIFAWSR